MHELFTVHILRENLYVNCLYSLSRNKIGDAGAKHLADFFLGSNCKQLEKLRYSHKIYQSVLVAYAVV